MITSDGLLFIQKLLITQDLKVALYSNDTECSFPGYSRLYLDPNKWEIDLDGNIIQNNIIFALHDKSLTYIDSVKVIANTNIDISIEKVEIPYILRYKGDYINIKVKINLSKSI